MGTWIVGVWEPNHEPKGKRPCISSRGDNGGMVVTTEGGGPAL